VLHLLTKRRQDLVAARTQTINRLHRLLVDLIPGGARRNLTVNRAAALLDQVAPTGAPAVIRWGSWLASSWLTSATWSSGSRPWRRASRPPSPSPTPAWSSCSGLGRWWPPPSSARSATSAGSPQAPLRRPHRHRPAGGLKRPGRPPPAVPCWGPEAESRLVHDGHGAGPPAQRRAGLLPAQAGRRQVGQGGAALPHWPSIGRCDPEPWVMAPR
jgi:hypothetical protein